MAADGGRIWRILRTETGRVERELKASGGSALDLVGFSADSRRLAAWGTRVEGGAGCQVWEVATGKNVGDQGILKGVESRSSARLSADGQLASGTVAVHTSEIPRHVLAKVWEVESGKEVCSIGMLANGIGYTTISPDGKQLATWGSYSPKDAHHPTDEEIEANKTVQLWDVTTGKPTARFHGMTGHAHTAVFSPDGKILVTGGDPTELWDTATGKRIRTLRARQYQGKSFAFSPDSKTLAGVGHTGWVELWDVASGLPVGVGRCEAGSPLGVVFPANGPPLAYGQDGQAVRLWQLPEGRPLTSTEGHTDRVVAIAFSSDNRSLVSVGADNRVLRWDLGTGRQSVRIGLDGDQGRNLWPGSQELLTAVLFPGAKRLASLGDRESLKVYDLANGHEEFSLRASGDRVLVSSGAISPDGTKVASFGARRHRMGPDQPVLMVWDVATGTAFLEQPVASSSEISVGFTADSSRVVSSTGKPLPDMTQGFEVMAWELSTGKPLGRTIFPQAKHPVRIAAGWDTRSVLIDLGDGRVIAWDVNTGQTLQTVKGAFPSGRVPGFVVPPGAPPVVSADGRLLAVGTHSPLGSDEYLPKDGIVRVVDLASGRMKFEFHGHQSLVTALAFSSDGKTLASGSSDTTVLLWDLTKAEK